MSGQNNQNRKLQNLINIGKMADDSVGAAELVDDSVGNAALGTDQLKSLAFNYDFAVLGGAAGAITLANKAGTGAQTIPDNALIVRAYIEVVTAATSDGSATIMLGFTGDTNAFIAATRENTTPYTAGLLTELTAGIPIKTTGAVSVLATVATADLTAGKFIVWVEYYEGA